MKRLLSIALSVAIMLMGLSTALAKEEIIEAEGTYVMDSRLDETAASATARAREEAKRSAVERAGVYVESYSEVVEFRLSKDEVRTIAAQMLQVLDEKSSIAVLQDNLLEFTVHIKALVDVSDTDKLQALMSNKQQLDAMTTQNVELQAKYDELKKQMEELKREYNSAGDAQKVEIKKAAALNDARFKAAQELDQGNGCYNRGDYYSALAAYTRSLALEPDYVNALNNRANTYAALGQYPNAMTDLQKALELNPNSAEAHNNLGSVYVSMNRFDEALKEYSEALRLKSDYADAYINRGWVYYRQEKYAEALSDAQKAAALNPNDPSTRDLINRANTKLGR